MEGPVAEPDRAAHHRQRRPTSLAGPAAEFDYDILGGLAVHAGRLFVAGQFGAVNGVTCRYLVALDATSGAVLPWTTTLRSGLALNTSTRVAVGDGRVYISAVHSQPASPTRTSSPSTR